MSGAPNRRYLDPGSRLSGRQEPPRPCQVLTWWGPGGGPRNVLVEYADGTRAVIPFPRRLRRPVSLSGPRAVVLASGPLIDDQEDSQ